MAEKKAWYASYGPYMYDDSRQYEDGEFMEGARVEGQILIEGAPTEPHHVLRLEDALDINVGVRKTFMLGD